MHTTKPTYLSVAVICLIALVLSACNTYPNSINTNTLSRYCFDCGQYHPPTKTGGMVVIGSNAPPDSSNIVVNRDLNDTIYDAELDNALYQACTVQLPDFSLGARGWVGDGCLSATQSIDSEGGTVITVKLDPQAAWSDGTPVTSADWRLGFDATQDPAIGGIALSSPYDKATVAFPDPDTFVINYHQAFAPWRTDLASYYPLPAQQYTDSYTPSKYSAGNEISFAGGSNPGKPDPGYRSKVMQSDLGVAKFNDNAAKDTTQSITNGPYMLAGPFTDGTTTTMVPNPHYHSNYFHKPVLDKLIFQISFNANAEALAYTSGQYDAAFDFTFSNLQSFSTISSEEQIVTGSMNLEYLGFIQRDAAPNAKGTANHHSIFTNESVRKAFEESFNKCGAIQALFYTACTDPAISTDQFTTQIDPNYDTSAPAVKFDVADANKLLDAAGFKLDSKGVRTYPGTTNEVSIAIGAKSNRLDREAMVTLMKDEWSANLHINATIVRSPPSVPYYWDLLKTPICDICETAYTGSGEADQTAPIFDPNQIPSKKNPFGENWMGITDSQITQMLSQGRTTLDPATRVTIYKQLYGYLLTHAIIWGLYASPAIVLVKPTLGNYWQYPTQQGADWNVANWYTTGNH